MNRSPSLRLERLEGREVPAATLPAGFEQRLVADNFHSTIDVEILPDGRVLVAEQEGVVRVVKDGAVLAEPFLELEVASYTYAFQEEEGLMSVVADPDFAINGFIYVYHTVPDPDGNFNRVSRFHVVGDAVEADSRVTIFDSERIENFYSYHIGGSMKFGPDGKIYIAVGDSGTSERVQDINAAAGKILRINKDGSIPSDNPFVNEATGIGRAVYAYGFRNPFKMGFDPATGRLFVSDVGESAFEEINQVRAGQNYGWPLAEGVAGDPAYVDPVYAYAHGEGQFEGYAIVGAAWYRAPAGTGFPAAYNGDFFFGDIVKNWVHVLDPVSGEVRSFGEGFTFVVDLEVGPDGALYVLERGAGYYASGRLSRVEYTGSLAPYVVDAPSNLIAGVGQPATFTVEAGGEGVTYQWQRNGIDIPDAVGPTLTLPAVALADDASRIRVVLTNADGISASESATLNVIDAQPPAATILTPAAGGTFQAGVDFAFAGNATDARFGQLGPDAFTWEAYIVTNGVPRPLLNPVSGIQAGTVFVPPDMAYNGTDVRVLLRLTVTSPSGLKTLVEQNYQGEQATVRVTSNLPDRQAAVIDVFGVFHPTPYIWDGVVGINRYVAAKPSIDIEGDKWVFDHWSDGGERGHRVAPESGGQSLIAFYRKEIVTVTPPSTPPPPTVPPRPTIVRGLFVLPLSATADAPGRVTAPRARNFDDSLYLFLRWQDGVTERERALPAETLFLDAVYAPAAPLAVGAGAEQSPVVQLFDAATHAAAWTFVAYEPESTGGVLLATGDVNNDGTPDVVTGPGAGTGPLLKVFNGRDGELLRSEVVFEPTFTGGLFVAAGDFNGDGFADLVAAAARGGGPRVRVIDGRSGVTLADFFGIADSAFRGGARVAVGDVNGDGTPDLVVVAGPGGGPRVAIYDGKTIGGTPVKLVTDFFVFEQSLRNGVYVSAGDQNGDGSADIAFGAGPNGGPRVQVLDGRVLSASGGVDRQELANFFAGDPTDRGGVPVAFTQADDDGLADLLTGSGKRAESRVYLSETLANLEPEFESLELDGGLTGGVFVG